MLTKFVLKTPGEHREIAKGKLPHVPRQGDMVTLNDVTRTVHSVDWNVTEGSVTVFLNE